MSLNKLFKNGKSILYFLPRVILDIFLFNLSTIISVWIRFDYSIKMSYVYIDDPVGILENVLFVTLEFIFRLPWQMWEFVSLKEFLDLFYVVTLTKIITAPFFYVLRPKIAWSRGAYLISWLVALALLASVRLFIRTINEKYKTNSVNGSQKREKRVIIIGAGDAGEKVIREILARSDLKYQIIGILDDDLRKKGGKIHGFSVFGAIEELPHIVNERDIDIILYAIPSADRELLRKVVSLASQTRAEIKAVPGIWEILGGKVNVSDIKSVQLEDLLSRPSIKMDFSEVKEYISNATILVTGAGGSIGSEIARQVVLLEPQKIILLDRAENRVFEIERELLEKKKFKKVVPLICDMRDREKVFKVFEKYKPDVIFHAAAHKHVPLMEKNVDEAVINNIFGTKNLLDASLKFGVKRFINISTDKAVNPINIMGASKRVIELMLQYYAHEGNVTIFTSVRFGNVLGSDGSVIEVFKKQLRETGVITITDPQMERFFMLIPEAVQLVLQAGALDKDGGNIFVLKMGEQVNIMELARTFIKLSGYEIGKDVKIKIIGNRGGEKIKEELWGEGEVVEPTENPYILKIKSNCGFLDKETFYGELEELKNAAENLDYIGIRKIFETLIPEANLK